MKFDEFTVSFLLARPDAPKLREAEGNRLQDAHLRYLSKLHDEGNLLAAGPVMGPRTHPLRGFCIFRVPPDEAKKLMEDDPMFKAGRHIHEHHPWIVPTGVISFPKSHLPVSTSEVSD